MCSLSVKSLITPGSTAAACATTFVISEVLSYTGASLSTKILTSLASGIIAYTLTNYQLAPLSEERVTIQSAATTLLSTVTSLQNFFNPQENITGVELVREDDLPANPPVQLRRRPERIERRIIAPNPAPQARQANFKSTIASITAACATTLFTSGVFSYAGSSLSVRFLTSLTSGTIAYYTLPNLFISQTPAQAPYKKELTLHLEDVDFSPNLALRALVTSGSQVVIFNGNVHNLEDLANGNRTNINSPEEFTLLVKEAVTQACQNKETYDEYMRNYITVKFR